MKLTFDADDLGGAVALASLAVSRTASELENWGVVSPASDGRVRIGVYTSGLIAECEIACEIDGTFDTHRLIPIPALRSLTKSPPASRVTLKFAADKVTTRCGKYVSTVATPTKQWRLFENTALVAEGTADGLNLRGAVSRIRPAVLNATAVAAGNAVRIQDGALFSGDGSSLRIYATDNNRIARTSIDSNFKGSFAIPKESLSALAEILKCITGDVEIRLGPNSVEFVMATARLVSLLIESQAAATLDRVFVEPAKPAAEIVCDSKQLWTSIARVLEFADSKQLIMANSGKELVLAAKATGLSAASDVVECIGAEGEASFSVNGDFLTSAVRNSEQVRLTIDSVPDRPIIVEHIDGMVPATHVIGQMRT